MRFQRMIRVCCLYCACYCRCHYHMAQLLQMRTTDLKKLKIYVTKHMMEYITILTFLDIQIMINSILPAQVRIQGGAPGARAPP